MWRDPITGRDKLQICYDPATALVIFAVGTIVSSVGQAIQGHMEYQEAQRIAEQEEKTAKKEFGLARKEGRAQFEHLRDEEETAQSSLLTGAARAGVEIDREEIDPVERKSISDLISEAEKSVKGKKSPEEVEDYDYNAVVDPGKPDNTLEALSHDISKQITKHEESVMRNLGSAKLGFDTALFSAQSRRRQGTMALVSGYFNATSTLLEGGSAMYGYGKQWEQW